MSLDVLKLYVFKYFKINFKILSSGKNFVWCQYLIALISNLKIEVIRLIRKTSSAKIKPSKAYDQPQWPVRLIFFLQQSSKSAKKSHQSSTKLGSSRTRKKHQSYPLVVTLAGWDGVCRPCREEELISIEQQTGIQTR